MFVHFTSPVCVSLSRSFSPPTLKKVHSQFASLLRMHVLTSRARAAMSAASAGNSKEVDSESALTAAFEDAYRRSSLMTLTNTAATRLPTSTLPQTKIDSSTAGHLERLIRATYATPMNLDEKKTTALVVGAELEISLASAASAVPPFSLVLFGIMFRECVQKRLPEAELLDYAVDFTATPTRLILRCRHRPVCDVGRMDRAKASMKELSAKRKATDDADGDESAATDSKGEAAATAAAAATATDEGGGGGGGGGGRLIVRSRKRFKSTPPATAAAATVATKLKRDKLVVLSAESVAGDSAKSCLSKSACNDEEKDLMATIVEYALRLHGEKTPLAVKGALSHRTNAIRLAVTGYQRLTDTVLSHVQTVADRCTAAKNQSKSVDTPDWVARVRIDMGSRKELIVELYCPKPAELDLYVTPAAVQRA